MYFFDANLPLIANIFLINNFYLKFDLKNYYSQSMRFWPFFSMNLKYTVNSTEQITRHLKEEKKVTINVVILKWVSALLLFFATLPSIKSFFYFFFCTLLQPCVCKVKINQFFSHNFFLYTNYTKGSEHMKIFLLFINSIILQHKSKQYL